MTSAEFFSSSSSLPVSIVCRFCFVLRKSSSNGLIFYVVSLWWNYYLALCFARCAVVCLPILCFHIYVNLVWAGFILVEIFRVHRRRLCYWLGTRKIHSITHWTIDRLSHQSAAGHRHVGRSVTMYYCRCMSRLWVEVRLSISDAIEKYKHLLVLEVATVSWMAVQITVDAMSPGRPTARGEMRIGGRVGDLHRISILI